MHFRLVRVTESVQCYLILDLFMYKLTFLRDLISSFSFEKISYLVGSKEMKFSLLHFSHSGILIHVYNSCTIFC